MKLEPKNKRLSLELVKQDKQEASTDFVFSSKKPPSLDNNVYRVLDISSDCVLSVVPGTLVLIEGNMVEESKVGDTVFLTCKENFVIGIMKE